MIIYGINPIGEALRSTSPPERIWITRGKSNPRLRKILELAQSRGVPVRFESSQFITKKASTHQHQEIAGQISAIGYTDFESLWQSGASLLLLVDGVEDPRNLGALLRTAEAAGVEGVLIPTRRNCSVTPVVVKVSAGAAIHLRISRIGNVIHALEQLKKQGYRVIGLDVAGEDSVSEIDVDVPTVLVVGGEHQGMRRLVREHCDSVVSLPMKGKVSSLNLSVAAGVLLYEIVLKKLTPNP